MYSSGGACLRHADLATALIADEPGLTSALLDGEGTARWRLRLKEENRDKVIVFFEDAYGIFLLAELAVLSGLHLRRLPSHLGSHQDILLRFGISPGPS